MSTVTSTNTINTRTSDEDAIDYLKKDKLLERIQLDIGRSGVIGEEINRLLIYLIFTSRKTKNPLHLICYGASGEGKTYLLEKVGELIPEEDKIELTSITKNALYYFDDSNLDGKLIIIEDMEGIKEALYPIRELQSKRRLTKTIASWEKDGQLKARYYQTKGRVTIAGATTNDRMLEDNSTRSIHVLIDNSRSQDQRIINYLKKIHSGEIDLRGQLKTTTAFSKYSKTTKSNYDP